MNTKVSFLVLAAALSGCGLIKVNGGAVAPEASPTPASTEKTQGETSTASTTPAADAPKEKTKGEVQCEHTLLGTLQHVGELERTGDLSVSIASAGFSAEPLKKNVTSCYAGYNETPSEAALAEADAMNTRMREAALESAKKGKLQDAAAPDSAAEAAIKKDFLDKHPGSEIKRVFMTSAWKTNYNGLAVRNRYKDAIVVMAVKDTDICLRVPANAAQAATTGGGFDSKWKHDIFDKGRVVPCK